MRAEASGTPMTSSHRFGRPSIQQKLLVGEKRIWNLTEDIKKDRLKLQGTLDNIERFGVRHILQQKETQLNDLTHEYWDMREVLELMEQNVADEIGHLDDELMVDVDG
jgi:hypothetical protein